MRRSVERLIIHLKEDLKLAKQCQLVKSRLLSTITNSNYFSPELIAYFAVNDNKQPFIITSTEPQQVIMLKKAYNTLHHAQQLLDSINNIELSRNRTIGALGFDVVKTAYSALQELYKMVELINDSPTEIQYVLGEQVQLLMSQINTAAGLLEDYMPHNPETLAGSVLGDVVNTASFQPSSTKEGFEKISQNFLSIPQCLDELQKIVVLEASRIEVNTSIGNQALQQEVSTNVELLNTNMMNLLNNSNNKFAFSFHAINLMKKIASNSVHIINALAPLTKHAYLNATDQLLHLKHHVVPQLIAQIEEAEEHMGLRPGALTEPIIAQLDKHYTVLANQVEKIASAAGLLDRSASASVSSTFLRLLMKDRSKLDPGEKLPSIAYLTVLQDDEFLAQRTYHQLTRLSAAQEPSIKHAAERFFARLNSYGLMEQAYYTGNLANLPINEKEELIKEYKQIQSHVAILYPAVDKLIVDRLTKSAAQFSDFSYKLAFGVTDFSQITACQNSVLNHIDQDIAQRAFKVRLIKNTINYSNQLIQSSKFKAIISDDYAPFKLINYSRNDNVNADFFQKTAIDLGVQILQLEEATEGIDKFFSLIRGLDRTNNMTQFSIIEKELLMQEYKKIQPQVLALGLNHFNTLLLNNLTSTGVIKEHLSVAAVEAIKDRLDAQVASFLKEAQQAVSFCTSQEYIFKQQQSLISQGDELERKTLFNVVNDLQLSHSINDLFHRTLKPYLKEHTSSVILRALTDEHGEFNEALIPYPSTEFYKESSEIVAYKKIINAVYYLEKGCASLESLHVSKDSINFVQRGREFYAAGAALYNGSNALSKIATDPVLGGVATQFLTLLEPLKAMPLISGYMNAPSIAVKTHQNNVLDSWQEQQNIVEKGLAATPVAPDVGRAVEHHISSRANALPKLDTQLPLRVFATTLYSIPTMLEQLKPDSPRKKVDLNPQIEEFINTLSGLKINFSSMKKVAKLVKEMQKQLTLISTLGREVIDEQLNNICLEMAKVLIAAADEAELHLGLKPGTYSAEVQQRFNTFYHQLVDTIVMPANNTLNELTITIALDEQRIKREVKRLAEVHEGAEIDAINTLIFGDNFATNNLIYEAYSALHALSYQQVSYAHIDVEDFSELKADAAHAYQKIQTRLEAVNPIFTVDFIQQCTDESSLHAAVEQLKQHRVLLYAALNEGAIETNTFGLMVELHFFSLHSDFTKQEHQQIFLQIYEQMQPYLQQGHHHFNMKGFLRELQTPDDFQKAQQHLIDSTKLLKEVLEGMAQSKSIKTQLIVERIEYLNTALIGHKEQQVHEQRTMLVMKIQQLEQLLVDEQKNTRTDNPCYEEKMLMLQQQLLCLQQPDMGDEAAVKIKLDQCKILFQSLWAYNYAVDIYADLQLMKQMISTANKSKYTGLNEDKLNKIEAMQRILVASNDPITSRLEQVVQLGLEAHCKSTLENQADDSFKKIMSRFFATMHAIYQIVSFLDITSLFKSSSINEEVHTSNTIVKGNELKQKLQEIKDTIEQVPNCSYVSIESPGY